MTSSCDKSQEDTKTVPAATDKEAPFGGPGCPFLSKLWNGLWQLTQFELELNAPREIPKTHADSEAFEQRAIIALKVAMCCILDNKEKVQALQGSASMQKKALARLLLGETYASWARSELRVKLSKIRVNGTPFPRWLLVWQMECIDETEMMMFVLLEQLNQTFMEQPFGQGLDALDMILPPTCEAGEKQGRGSVETSGLHDLAEQS